MQGRYRQVLAQPAVARAVVPYVLARLPASMILLALLLFIRHESGSFVTAGGVSAAFAVGVAVTAPVLGRLVDLRGQTRVLVATSTVHPLALLAVILTASAQDPVGLVLGAAALAGASLPPMSACMRALWPGLLRDPDERETAFGLEAVVVEVCELAGPLLVGALTAGVSARAAVMLSGVLTCAGTLLFALSPPSLAAVGVTSHSRRWRGPLAAPGVRWLLGIIALSTSGLAAFEVSVAAFATRRGNAASTGTLLALWVAGSLVGGWLYGARRRRAALAWQLIGLLLLVMAGAVLPLLATGTGTMACFLLIAGLGIAPAIAVQLAVMAEVAPERSRTEAFTWASTANFLGIGAGSALAGMGVDRFGMRGGVLTAVGLAGAAVLLAVAGCHRLGLPRFHASAHDEAAVDAADDLAIFEELLVGREDARAALSLAVARNEELTAEIAALTERLAALEHPLPEPPPLAEPTEKVRAALARLDTRLADLYVLDQRRDAVLQDIEELRAELQSSGLPANVTALPRQSHGA